MKLWLPAGFLTLLALVLLAAPAPNLPNLPNLDGAPVDTISIGSLNLDHQGSFEKVIHDVEAAPRLSHADIILLQEVSHVEGGPSIASRLADRMGYQVAFAPEGPKVYDRGLAVVSKFPVVDSKVEWLTPYNLHFKTRHRFALAVTLRLPSGDLRIWNVHLDTRINPEQRLGQLQPVMDEAAKATGPRLIGGISIRTTSIGSRHMMPGFPTAEDTVPPFGVKWQRLDFRPPSRTNWLRCR